MDECDREERSAAPVRIRYRCRPRSQCLDMERRLGCDRRRCARDQLDDPHPSHPSRNDQCAYQWSLRYGPTRWMIVWLRPPHPCGPLPPMPATAGAEGRQERLTNAGLPGGDAQCQPQLNLYLQDEVESGPQRNGHHWAAPRQSPAFRQPVESPPVMAYGGWRRSGYSRAVTVMASNRPRSNRSRPAIRRTKVPHLCVEPGSSCRAQRWL